MPERGAGRARTAPTVAPPWPAGRDGWRAWTGRASLGVVLLGGVFLERIEYGLGMAGDFHRTP